MSNVTPEMIERLKENYPKSFSKFKSACKGKSRIVATDEVVQKVCETIWKQNQGLDKDQIVEVPDEGKSDLSLSSMVSERKKGVKSKPATDQAPTRTS